MQQAVEPQAGDKRETECLLYGFLDMRAKTDDSLTVEQSKAIVVTVNTKGGVSNVDIAAIVGRRLAAVGTHNRQISYYLNLQCISVLAADEIDSKYDRELKEAVELTQSQTSERALGTFRKVAKNLFEWTEGSIRKCPASQRAKEYSQCFCFFQKYIIIIILY